MKIDTKLLCGILIFILLIIGIFFLYGIIKFDNKQLLAQFGINYNPNAYKLIKSNGTINGDLDFLEKYDESKEFLVCADITFYPNQDVYVKKYKFVEYGEYDSVTVFNKDETSKCQGYNTAIHSHDDDCHFSTSDMHIYERYLNNNFHLYSIVVCDYGKKMNIATPNNFLGYLYDIKG